MVKPKNRLLVAGGGTGGHVLAGVAIAEQWKKQNADHEILFVGASGGIEERLVPKNGFNLKLLSIGTLNRVTIFRKIKTIVQLPFSMFKSIQILLKFKPTAVIGVGGYASGPIVLMAKLLGYRTAILEQNSVPGLTNRILGKIVSRIFCAFPNGEDYFSSKKVVFTGNPVRALLSETPHPQGNDNRFLIFIFGGSQGAQGINSLVIKSLQYLTDLKDRIEFVHQTGEKDYVRVYEAYQHTEFLFRVEKFIFEMNEVYRRASLVICRAGSSTLSEVAAVGRATILIPFPYASDNHQEKNARVFEGEGASLVMDQNTSDPKELALKIRTFYENPDQIKRMEVNVKKFQKPNAANDIVRCLKE